MNQMSFYDWLQVQLDTHQISTRTLSTKSGVTLSTLYPGYLNRHPLNFDTVIVICETLVTHSDKNVQDFITLVQEALATIPQYQYAINRLEKKQ